MSRAQTIAAWVSPKSPAKIPPGRKVNQMRMGAPVLGGEQALRDNRAFLKVKTTEHGEQKAVIHWWAFMHKSYDLPEWVLYAIPNAAKRTPKLASWMKSEGMRKGVMDLSLDVPVGRFHGLKLEMKLKPNVVSPEQQNFINYYTEAGYFAVVCWSADEAMDAIKRYLAGEA